MLPWHEVREARECHSRLSALRLLGAVMNGDGHYFSGCAACGELALVKR
jgi:hypothetical protein